MRNITKAHTAYLEAVTAATRFRYELEKLFPRGAWFEVLHGRHQKRPSVMQVRGVGRYNSFGVEFSMPKKSGRGFIRRSVLVNQIGRQVNPPAGQEETTP